ncbi:MAG: SprB repeat-containing protein [Cyclobacteriaceae bacterium]
MNTKFLLPVQLLFLTFMISCSSENGEDIIEDLKFDCSQSDLSLTVSQQKDPSCTESGSITVAASGGQTPYSYSLNDGASQSSATFDNLQIGSYDIVVTDANECTKTVSATLNSELGFTASFTVADCGEGTIEVSTVPAGNYTYSLNGGASQESNIFDNLNAGNYEIVVTNDGGCTATLTNIEIKPEIRLSTQIVPIITSNCATPSCHGGSQSPNLSNNNNIIASANRIKARTTAGTMPPSGSLPQSEVDLIAGWVDCGADDN